VDERRPRFRSTPEDRQRLTEGFLRACASGDLAGLTALLAEDVTVWSDGGGKVAAARRPVRGREAVGRFLIGISRLLTRRDQVEVTEMNGSPAVVVRREGRPFSVMTLEIGEGSIRAVRNQVNPDKLGHLGVG
jgi:RNA polymerase sigma-70 factor (ECF subfamily)